MSQASFSHQAWLQLSFLYFLRTHFLRRMTPSAEEFEMLTTVILSSKLMQTDQLPGHMTEVPQWPHLLADISHMYTDIVVQLTCKYFPYACEHRCRAYLQICPTCMPTQVYGLLAGIYHMHADIGAWLTCRHFPLHLPLSCHLGLEL